jgi:hypothetical protein
MTCGQNDEVCSRPQFETEPDRALRYRPTAAECGLQWCRLPRLETLGSNENFQLLYQSCAKNNLSYFANALTVEPGGAAGRGRGQLQGSAPEYPWHAPPPCLRHLPPDPLRLHCWLPTRALVSVCSHIYPVADVRVVTQHATWRTQARVRSTAAWRSSARRRARRASRCAAAP